MPLATWTATETPPDRFASFTVDGTGAVVWFFNPIPETIFVTNTSAVDIAVYVDKYVGPPPGTYNGNVIHRTFAAGVSTPVGWHAGDLNWLGVGFNGGDFLPAGTYHLSHDAASSVQCQYGTQPTAGAQLAYYLTPGLIDVWLSTVGMPWLAPAFTALWFTSITAASICGTGPPPIPVIDLSTLNATFTTVLELIKVVAWPNICECKPGTPPPTPFPIQSAPEPVGWPTLPAISCSNADICTTLVGIQHQLVALQHALGQDLALTTLIQRYRLPFASIPGAAHSNMVASGSFAISRLIGMKVEITGLAQEHHELVGNPPYVIDLGWMSILTADGMIEEKRIAQMNQQWFPTQMQDALTFGFFLNPGVTARFTELQAEP
jgi:hypothetical protein